jgi:outer membrane lipoprotein LolB
MLVCGVALSACMTLKLPKASIPWDERMRSLQQQVTWRLEGRAAAALGSQGWQATLAWHEKDAVAEVRLSGPFGMGTVLIKQTDAGISVNGAQPSDAALEQLRERIGFEAPLSQLRFWLLGVPDPAAQFDLTRNAQDRAQHLTQAGWTIDYDRYLPTAGDVLPALVVLKRDDIRVRILVDRWELHP